VEKLLISFCQKKFKKKYAISNGKFSAMKELYYDEELCGIIDCELFRNLQLVSRPIYKLKNYDEYSLKYRSYLYEYLYDNATAIDTLQKIEDIAAITSINYNSITGMIVIAITIVIMIIILSSYFVIINKKFEFYLQMYDKVSWFVMLLGLCILISYNFTLLGEINDNKCNLSELIIIFGISMFFYPTLIHEIINFHETNKYTEFFKKNKLFVLIGLIAVDLIFGILMYVLSPWKVESTYIDGGKNFNTCINQANSKIILLFIIYFVKFILFLSIAFLTFLECNIKQIHNDMKTVTTLLYLNTIIVILMVVINFVNIKQFYLYYTIKIIAVSTITIVNYITILWIRICYEKSNNGNVGGVNIVKSKQSEGSSLMKQNYLTKGNYQTSNIISVLLQYHFSEGSKSLNNNDDSVSNSSTSSELIIYTSIISSSQVAI